MTNYFYGLESYFTIMSNITLEELALYSDNFDKQHYAVYEKVKDLPDDVIVSFNLKNLEGEVFARHTMPVGDLRELAKDIEENRKPKE